MNPEAREWFKSGYSTNWNFLPYYERAIQWIKDHTIGSGGISFTDKQEVINTWATKEFVPVLKLCGERKLAAQYKKCAKDMEGDLFSESPHPKSIAQALEWAKGTWDDSSIHSALGLKYLLDKKYDRAKIDVMLMNKIAPMDKSGALYDPVIGRILPGALCIYAELCYKLGHYRRGDKLLQTVCAMQRESGGWFGSSYGKKQFDYFNDEELCSVNLYFLNAIHAYNDVFDSESSNQIDPAIINKIKTCLPELKEEAHALIMNSEFTSGLFECNTTWYQDTFVNCISEKKDSFDVVLAINSMAFNLRPKKMIEELFRVCKPGGYVIIVDKNITRAKHFKLLPNEQWFDANEINDEMINYGDTQHFYFKVGEIQEMCILWRSMKRPKEIKK